MFEIDYAAIQECLLLIEQLITLYLDVNEQYIVPCSNKQGGMLLHNVLGH